MVGNWTFVSDWRGLEEFQYSNYTLRMGKEVGSSGKGDYDDFSILLASLIEAIGGTPRIVFAYGPFGGHAYTEVYLGKENDREVDEMLEWLRSRYDVEEPKIDTDLESNDMWLNMDWWKDSSGTNHPGGPFYQADKNITIYIREDLGRIPLTPIKIMPPIIRLRQIPLDPKIGTQIKFNASGSYDPDGDIVDYEWNYGDGGQEQGTSMTTCYHTYNERKNFSMNLTVTDNKGAKSSKTLKIDLAERNETIRKIDIALEKDPKNASLWVNRGISLHYLERYDEAEQAYNEAIEIDPKDKYTWKSKGWTLTKFGKYHEALQAYEIALEIDPKDADSWDSKGWALYYKTPQIR